MIVSLAGANQRYNDLLNSHKCMHLTGIIRIFWKKSSFWFVCICDISAAGVASYRLVKIEGREWHLGLCYGQAHAREQAGCTKRGEVAIEDTTRLFSCYSGYQFIIIVVFQVAIDRKGPICAESEVILRFIL